MLIAARDIHARCGSNVRGLWARESGSVRIIVWYTDRAYIRHRSRFPEHGIASEGRLLSEETTGMCEEAVK